MSRYNKNSRYFGIIERRDGMVKTRLSCGHVVWTTEDRLRKVRQLADAAKGEK